MSEQQTAPSTVAAASKASSTPPSPVEYIHHLKFPVADLDRSVHLTGNPARALAECWYWIRKLQARYIAGD